MTYVGEHKKDLCPRCKKVKDIYGCALLTRNGWFNYLMCTDCAAMKSNPTFVRKLQREEFLINAKRAREAYQANKIKNEVGKHGI